MNALMDVRRASRHIVVTKTIASGAITAGIRSRHVPKSQVKCSQILAVAVLPNGAVVSTDSYRTKSHRVEAPATSKGPTSSRKTSVSATPAPITSITATSTMFRTALTRSARCIAQASARTQQPAVRRAIVSPFVSSTRITVPAISIAGVRCYAGSSGLAQEEVTGRIMDLLKNFDKVSSGCRDFGVGRRRLALMLFLAGE